VAAPQPAAPLFARAQLQAGEQGAATAARAVAAAARRFSPLLLRGLEGRAASADMLESFDSLWHGGGGGGGGRRRCQPVLHA
jgi:hypothetical protein